MKYFAKNQTLKIAKLKNSKIQLENQSKSKSINRLWYYLLFKFDNLELIAFFHILKYAYEIANTNANRSQSTGLTVDYQIHIIISLN